MCRKSTGLSKRCGCAGSCSTGGSILDSLFLEFYFEGSLITLVRNKFIANYLKGTISFVDANWKIIHRAAGWDALRFLLIVCRNLFFICFTCSSTNRIAFSRPSLQNDV